MALCLANWTRNGMDTPPRVAHSPRTAIAGSLDSRVPGLHLGNVESLLSPDDQVDLRTPGGMREKQVTTHHRVGKVQQKRQVDRSLAETAANAPRKRQFAQCSSQNCEKEAEDWDHRDRVSVRRTLKSRTDARRRACLHTRIDAHRAHPRGASQGCKGICTMNPVLDRTFVSPRARRPAHPGFPRLGQREFVATEPEMASRVPKCGRPGRGSEFTRPLRIGESALRKVTGSGRIRQGGVEGVRNGAQIWSTIAA